MTLPIAVSPNARERWIAVVSALCGIVAELYHNMCDGNEFVSIIIRLFFLISFG